MGNYTPNQITEGTIKRWANVVKVLGLLALILYIGEVLSFCTGSEKSTFSVRQASVLPFLKYQCVLSELQIKLLIFLMATHFW